MADEDLGQLKVEDEVKPGDSAPPDEVMAEEGVLGDTGSEEMSPSESSSSLSSSTTSRASSAYTDATRNQIRSKSQEIMVRLRKYLSSNLSYSNSMDYFNGFKRADLGSKLAAFAAACMLMHYKYPANEKSLKDAWRSVKMDPIITQSNFEDTINKWRDAYFAMPANKALSDLEERFKKGEVGEAPLKIGYYQSWPSFSQSYTSSSSYQSSSKDEMEESEESEPPLEKPQARPQEKKPEPIFIEPVRNPALTKEQKEAWRVKEIELLRKGTQLAKDFFKEPVAKFKDLSEDDKMRVESVRLIAELAFKVETLKNSGIALGQWYYDCVKALAIFDEAITVGNSSKANRFKTMMKDWVSND